MVYFSECSIARKIATLKCKLRFEAGLLNTSLAVVEGRVHQLLTDDGQHALHPLVGSEPARAAAFFLPFVALLVLLEGAEHSGHEVGVVDGSDPDGPADVMRLRAELAPPVHRRPRDQLVLRVLPVLVWKDLIDIHMNYIFGPNAT